MTSDEIVKFLSEPGRILVSLPKEQTINGEPWLMVGDVEEHGYIRLGTIDCMIWNAEEASTIEEAIKNYLQKERDRGRV